MNRKLAKLYQEYAQDLEDFGYYVPTGVLRDPKLYNILWLADTCKFRHYDKFCHTYRYKICMSNPKVYKKWEKLRDRSLKVEDILMKEEDYNVQVLGYAY